MDCTKRGGTLLDKAQQGMQLWKINQQRVALMQSKFTVTTLKLFLFQ